VRGGLGIAIVAICATVLGPPAAAQTAKSLTSGTGPVLFKADDLRYDRELGVVVASGHVEFSRADNVLLADTVTYNQREDTVTAAGNVTLLATGGEVFFADYMALSGDLKDGIIRDLRARFSDNSRLAAGGARRVGGVRNEMVKAVYTPCAACAADPQRPPLWQIRADRVVHDEVAHEIKYYDATMEMFGVPVMYLPYFQHPDPTVERKTGFLAPGFGSDSELGKIVRLPYFIDFAPNRDLTVEPIMTTREGPVLSGEYRERFAHGELRLAGSVTEGSAPSGSDEIRGHVKGYTRFDLGPNWRTGADIYRTSDDTYLARYRFDSRSLLTSRAYLEGFHGRDYTVFEGYSFQGLRSDDIGGQTPLVLPLARYSFVDEPGWLGGRWEANATALQVTRADGLDTRHLSVTPGWRLPVVADDGEVYTLFATVQADLYQFDHLVDAGNPGAPRFSGTSGRVFPQAGIDWRYPLIRHGNSFDEVIEPVVGLVVAPNGGNPSNIPNEDSQEFDLQDTNIFAANRFVGLDRVEGGQRVYYGLRTTLLGKGAGAGSASAFIGQSYTLRKDSTFAAGTGLNDNLSDIVGRVEASPSPLLDFLYRFRMDHEDFSIRRQELSATVGPPAVRLSVNYLSIDRQANEPEFIAREEVQAGIAAQVTPHWRAGAHMIRNLADPGGQLSQGFDLGYEDECFIITGNYSRSFSFDRDLRPSTTIFFRVIFKNLGEVQF
jgi:LPS-assembly protein